MKMLRPCVVLVLASAFHPGAYSQVTAADAGRVTFSNGRITIRVQNVSLRQLLDEIRQAAGVSLTTFPGADAEEISANIEDAPLEQGLRILLGRYDSMFLYGANDGERAELKKVWIYRKGEADGLEPASPEALASTRGLRDRLSDPDAGVRARAFAALLNRPGIEEKDAITRAVLTERDDSLRAGMIESVRSSGLEMQPEFWGALSADPSEHVRLLVLEALEGTAQVRDAAVVALTDPSPHVKLRAKEILDALGAGPAPGPGCDACVQQR